VIGLVRSELRKAFTTRLWWGLLIGVLALSAGLSVVIGAQAGVGRSGGAAGPGLDDPTGVRGVYAAGTRAGYLCALAFGVVAMAGEFRHQTVTATVLASPRRHRVVLAKLFTVFVLGLGYDAAQVADGLLGGIPVILVRGGRLFLGSAGTSRALVLTVPAIALWAVVGLGVATLIRPQILALAVAIAVAWVAEPVAALGLKAADLGSVARFLPGQATSALTTPATGFGGPSVTLLPWWAAALTLVGYAAASGVMGAAIMLRRDVT
jgi:ABC-2 type transport system permease protein